MKIRKAQIGDESSILKLIKGLAEYEKDLPAVINTEEALKKHLFEEQICYAYVAEMEGEIVGFVLYYISYSTWKGKCLYLEDFYIQPQYRRSGIGSLLFDKLVEICKTEGYVRMDWQVLEWNQLAIDFYEKKGATIDKEWYNGRLFF